MEGKALLALAGGAALIFLATRSKATIDQTGQASPQYFTGESGTSSGVQNPPPTFIFSSPAQNQPAQQPSQTLSEALSAGGMKSAATPQGAKITAIPAPTGNYGGGSSSSKKSDTVTTAEGLTYSGSLPQSQKTFFNLASATFLSGTTTPAAAPVNSSLAFNPAISNTSGGVADSKKAATITVTPPPPPPPPPPKKK